MLVSDSRGRLHLESLPVRSQGETLVELCQLAQASDGSPQLGSKIRATSWYTGSFLGLASEMWPLALPSARQMSVGEMIADRGGVRANVAKGSI
jgi:hypothetical protein